MTCGGGRQLLQGCREVLGNNHPETLKSVGMLAALYVEQAHSVNPQHPKYKEARRDRFTLAEPLYREAVAGFSQGLGPYNPTSLSYVHELARVLLDLEKPTEAEAVQVQPRLYLRDYISETAGPHALDEVDI